MDSPTPPHNRKRESKRHTKQHAKLEAFVERRAKLLSYQARVEAAQTSYCTERRVPVVVRPPPPPTPERPLPPPKPCCDFRPFLRLITTAAKRVHTLCVKRCPCCRKKKKPTDRFNISEIAGKVISSLRLSPDQLDTLRGVFAEIDADKSGNVSMAELWHYLDERPSKISDELYKLIDLDGSGALDYSEFICIVAT